MQPGAAPHDDCLVVVPLRSFDDPKTRLREVLDEAGRRALTMALATAVLDALGPTGLPVAVATDDDEVASFAGDRCDEVLRSGATGLSATVTACRDHARARGLDRMAVVPADLAHPDGLRDALRRAGSEPLDTVTAITDRHRDGTNVLVVPTAADFVFHYGIGSFAAHRDEAKRRGLRFRELDDELLGWDVDTPDDLARYRTASHDRP